MRIFRPAGKQESLRRCKLLSFRFREHNSFRLLLTTGCIALLFLLPAPVAGQLTGNKIIGSGGDYPTLAAAIADLNAQGAGVGGVTFNIRGGHVETVAGGNTTANPDIPAGLLITKGGTAGNPVVIRWDGSLTRPVLRAGTGIGDHDFVLGIAGQDI